MTGSQKYKPIRTGRSANVFVRDVNYHLLEWGNSTQPLLLLLHGWGDCAASFQFLVDELRQDWFVVAPDWRGFGRSQHRCSSYWFPDYLADLHQILEHYQPDNPVNVLGHSMGANVAGLYAGIFPDRIKTFINVEGFGLLDRDPVTAPDNYRRWMTQSRTMPSYKTYASYAELAERIISRSPTLAETRALFIAENWAETDDTGRIVLRADPVHKLPNAVLYRRAEAEACWNRVLAPVLIVVGEDSDFAAGANSIVAGNNDRGLFRDCSSVTIPDCGHMVHLEQPGELAKALERFTSGEFSE